MRYRVDSTSFDKSYWNFSHTIAPPPPLPQTKRTRTTSTSTSNAVIMINLLRKNVPVSNRLIQKCTHMPAVEPPATAFRHGKSNSQSRNGHPSIYTTEGFDNLIYVTNTFPEQCTFWKPNAPIAWLGNAALGLCIFPSWGEIPRLRNIADRQMYAGGVSCH